MGTNEREYMREVFQNQLSDVQGRLVEMAESVTTIMDKASTAFLKSDVALADEAIALAEANENRALALDEIVIRVLAKQSPVARDLRILVLSMHDAASLVRQATASGANGYLLKDASPMELEGAVREVRVGLRAGERGTELAALEILDGLGQRSALRFSRMEINVALPADTFQFKPPAGADILRP